MSARISLGWCPNGHSDCANAAPDVPDYMPEGQLCWPCAKSLIASLKAANDELREAVMAVARKERAA